MVRVEACDSECSRYPQDCCARNGFGDSGVCRSGRIGYMEAYCARGKLSDDAILMSTTISSFGKKLVEALHK